MKFRLTCLAAAVVILFSCEGGDEIALDIPDVSKQELGSGSPRLTSFKVTGGENPGLYYDFECPIRNFTVDAVCPYLEDASSVVVSFSGDYDAVLVDGEPQVSGVSKQDFSRPVLYEAVNSKGGKTSYLVKLRAANGVPIVEVETRNAAYVTSKTEYVEAEFRISNDPESGPLDASGKIRGRGNATFGYPKKPYKIKLAEKASVLGYDANKDWVLLAEYCDKSLMRTAWMCELSKLVGMPYTINYRHVEVILNGNYMGTYVLTDQVEKAKHRVDIADDGFLIENDNYWYQEALYFTSSRNMKYTFKYPDADDREIVKNDANYTYIKGFVDKMEAALYGKALTDPEKGWRQYLDGPTFAKWYLVNELSGNWEPNLYYMLPGRDSKLMMGPCWDAEWSLGLAARGNDWAGWAMPPKTSPVDVEIWSKNGYFVQLFKDPYFVSLVKEEWARLKPLLPELIAEMRTISESIFYTQGSNFQRWPILDSYIAAGLVALGAWIDEVDYVEDFFERRAEWFDSFIGSL